MQLFSRTICRIAIIFCSALLYNCTLSKPVEPTKIQEPVEEVATRTDPWILIDSKTERLTVFRKGQPDSVFENIAFGAAGVRQKVRQGDDVTPKGLYSIGWISRKSKFRLFIGLNYPSVMDAQLGLDNGIISRNIFDQISRAHSAGLIPPQNTALGGLLGIHGVGRGSLEIHRNINWTSGCVALENEQVERLANMVRPGVQVEIR